MIPRKPRRTVTLSCGRKELLYEIRQICYVGGDVVQEDAQDARHQMQDVTEDGNVDLITRQMDLIHAEVCDLMCNDNGEYVEDGHSEDDLMRETDRYEVTMTVEEGTRVSAVRLLGQLYHQLMVGRAVAWWFTLVHPDANKAALWTQEAQVKENAMRDIVNRVPTNLMIYPHPY